MNLEELKKQALEKRKSALKILWDERGRVQSPPCEQCGQAKTKPLPLKAKRG